MLTKKFFCPANAWHCPYWKEDGSCSLADSENNPIVECDEWNSPDNYFVWEDENGKRYSSQELLEMGYHFVNDEPVLPWFALG